LPAADLISAHDHDHLRDATTLETTTTRIATSAATMPDAEMHTAENVLAHLLGVALRTPSLHSANAVDTVAAATMTTKRQ
jgi:hypothetical protein